MWKKISKLNFLVILLCIIFLPTNVFASSAKIKRIYGLNRYQTCSKIVDEGWNTSQYAVIVNGENFPDALSASVLAKKYNAPILLSKNNNIDRDIIYQLKRLGVKKAFIVGGTTVIESKVENYINTLGIKTERFYGDNRTETSLAIAKQIGIQNGIILTTDADFTDALSISPAAGKLQIPIILIPKNFVPDSVNDFISDKNIERTYIVGGEDIISNCVASRFPNIKRIEGKNKYERNINIINTFQNKLNFSNLYIAYSENFPDALCGSAISAINGNPIVLMGDGFSNVTKSFMKSNAKSIRNINVLGGSAGINNHLIDQLNDIENLSNDKEVDYVMLKDNKEKPFVSSIYGYVKNNEIWVKYSDGTEEVLVVCHDGYSYSDVKKDIANILDPQLTPDKKKVYFRSIAWTTSCSIHVVDVESKVENYVTHGNILKVIQNGPYSGKLIINQHRYHDYYGAYDNYYLMDQDGNEIKNLGNDTSVLDNY